MTEIHTSYLVCGTPRSGSSLLCEALKNTGLAGRPEEYFWKGDEPFWSERWSVSTYQDYLTAARAAGTTDNGVFGAKVMWGYLEDFMAKLRHVPGNHVLSELSLLQNSFPNLHFVHITRRDKIRQAVSHWKAIQTGQWIQTGDAKPIHDPPRFDMDAIYHLHQEILAHESAWRESFRDWNVKPFVIEYEQLVVRYEASARDVLQFLDIEMPPDLILAERRLQKQSDALSEEWVQRYKQHFESGRSSHHRQDA